ncbi:hypothetical protein ACETU7_21310 [Rhodococcus sp. 3Y1]
MRTPLCCATTPATDSSWSPPIPRQAISPSPCGRIDLIADKAASPSSVFFGKVDLEHIGAVGHSQGGSAAINAAIDDRVDTAVAIQQARSMMSISSTSPFSIWPASRRNRLAGDRAGDVRGRRPRACRVSELRGATHFGTAINGGDMRGPSTAWLRYWLLDDPNARTEFFGASCGYCTDTQKFSDFDRNDLARQIPG